MCNAVTKLLHPACHAGEGPCLATFFVKRYWQLLMLRIMTGISVGGTFPLVFSLVRQPTCATRWPHMTDFKLHMSHTGMDVMALAVIGGHSRFCN